MKDLSKFIPDNAATESDFKKRDASPAKAFSPVVYESDDKESKELDSDFQEVRKRISTASTYAEEAVREAMELARASDHPAAWDVVGKLIETLTKVNKTMVDAHKTKVNSIKEKKVGESGSKSTDLPKQNNTQNNYFYGSPSEMAEMLKGKLDGSNNT